MRLSARKLAAPLVRQYAARTSRGLATAQRKPVVGGNWKCNAGNGVTLDSVDQLIAGLNDVAPGAGDSVDVFCAAPALYLSHVVANLKSPYVACAQNVWKETKGAFTGEISPEMYMDAGIKWTLVGHSERRDIFGETDDLLKEKIVHAQAAGMTVVACCGEHKEDREAGRTMDILKPQLEAIAAGTSDWSRLVIAYEPVWAIGTGLTATPDQAQDTQADIRSWISSNVGAEVADSVRIQYGGSVNADNADELSAMPDIDGFLVGGASLKADGFSTIFRAIAQ